MADWKDVLVDGKKIDPADLAASRIDFAGWLDRMLDRNRRIAIALAEGMTTNEAAEHFGVTAGRISQLRKVFRDDWIEYHGGLEEK